jgi:hypothetical protein
MKRGSRGVEGGEVPPRCAQSHLLRRRWLELADQHRSMLFNSTLTDILPGERSAATPPWPKKTLLTARHSKLMADALTTMVMMLDRPLMGRCPLRTLCWC